MRKYKQFMVTAGFSFILKRYFNDKIHRINMNKNIIIKWKIHYIVTDGRVVAVVFLSVLLLKLNNYKKSTEIV